MSQSMIKSLVILLILTVCKSDLAPDGFHYQSPATSASLFTKFPNILWTYLPTGLNGSTLWNKLTVNNFHHFSKISGFDFRFLSDQNVTKFLSLENNIKFTNMVSKLQRNGLGIEAKSDLVRAFLLYEHGGMWFDVDSYFTRDLTWTKRLYEWPWVFNRLSANPQVFFMTLRKRNKFNNNVSVIFDKELNQQVDLFPILQNWLILAKPKSLFYTDLLDSIGVCLEKGMDWVKINALLRGVDIPRLSNLGDNQHSFVLKNKQNEIQKSNKSPIKYAVDYYKMWNMYSESSGYFLLQNIDYAEMEFPPFFSIENLDDISDYSTDLLFIKYTRGAANEFNQRIGRLYNKSCTQVRHHVQPQSLFYHSIINVSSMFKELDNFKETFSYLEGKCNPLNEASSNIHDSFILIKSIITGEILCLLIVIAFIFFCSKCYVKDQKIKEATQQ